MCGFEWCVRGVAHMRCARGGRCSVVCLGQGACTVCVRTAVSLSLNVRLVSLERGVQVAKTTIIRVFLSLMGRRELARSALTGPKHFKLSPKSFRA